jgi:hypothetical protein
VNFARQSGKFDEAREIIRKAGEQLGTLETFKAELPLRVGEQVAVQQALAKLSPDAFSSIQNS